MSSHVSSCNQSEQFLEKKYDEQQNKPGIQKHYTCIFRILKLSLVLNVLLVVALLVVYVYRSHNFSNLRQGDEVVEEETIRLLHRGNSTKQNDENVVCLPCDYIGDDVKAVNTMYDVILKTKCNHKLCCFEKQKDITRFVMKALQAERYPQTVSIADDHSEFDWWARRPNSAHLTKDLESKELTWKTGSSKEMGFINGLMLQNNSIVIPDRADGLYFLYSVVTQDLSKFYTIPSSYHAIYKTNPYILDIYNRSRPDILIMNKYGGPAVKSRLHTSPLHGVFQLSGGDRVEVRSRSRNKQTFFHNELFSNYFGILKL